MKRRYEINEASIYIYEIDMYKLYSDIYIYVDILATLHLLIEKSCELNNISTPQCADHEPSERIFQGGERDVKGCEYNGG